MEFIYVRYSLLHMIYVIVLLTLYCNKVCCNFDEWNEKSEHIKINNDYPDNDMRPYEEYKDMFQISHSNFTNFVLKNVDPWVIVFHDDGNIISGWKTMATSLRGIIWVGVVNTNEEKLIAEMGFDKQTVTPAIVYPHGSKKFKRTHFAKVFTPIEAKNSAVTSLPDKLLRIKGDKLADFFLDSFTSTPSKFPAIIVTSDAIPPSMYKVLALRFAKYFNFGIMSNPSSSELATLGLQNHYFEFPSFFVFVTSNPIEPEVNAVMYKAEDMGEPNYPNLMRFLFYINREFRYQLPGDNMSNKENEAKMLDIRSIEEERFDFVSSSDNIKTEL